MNVGTGDVSSRPAPTRRLEDMPLVRGTGAYVGDLVTSDTLHCAFVRSPVAHGTITDIDVSMASSEPGVVGIFTAEDLDLADIPSVTGRGPGAEYMTRPVLARDRVRFVGDAVAVVVAESERAAADAADLVWVDVDELGVVDDARWERFARKREAKIEAEFRKGILYIELPKTKEARDKIKHIPIKAA